MGKKDSRKKAAKKEQVQAQVMSKKQERAARKQARKERARRQTAAEDLNFDGQMAAVGLRIVSITGDGNCMFRSISDQLCGVQANHWEYRKHIVDFINAEREQFEPFIEDDESFDDYIQRMGSDGEWGGHQELYAATQAYNVNIVIHQLDAPRLELYASQPEFATATLHLSYHGEFHYNSVRAADDFGPGPAQAIAMDRPPMPAAATGGTDRGSSSAENLSAVEKQVRISVPWVDLEVIRGTLREVNGDADAAVELLVSGFIPPDPAAEGDHDAVSQNPGAIGVVGGEVAASSAGSADSSPEAGDQGGGKLSASGKSGQKSGKTARADLCPCGSGKKYKKCCMKQEKRAKAFRAKKEAEQQKAVASSNSNTSGSADGGSEAVGQVARSLEVIAI